MFEMVVFNARWILCILLGEMKSKIWRILFHMLQVAFLIMKAPAIYETRCLGGGHDWCKLSQYVAFASIYM